MTEDLTLQAVSSDVWLQPKCQLASVDFFQNLNLKPDHNHDIRNLVPSAAYKIDRDGNCLFGTLSVLLTGSQDYKNQLRQIICDRMDQSMISEQQFSICSDGMCANAHEYLEKNRMREFAVWGGDIEVAVFCYLFNIRMFVYVLSIKKWVVYSNNLQEDAKDMFILNWGRHWEPVCSVEPLTNSGTHFITNILIPMSNCGARFVRKRKLLFAEGTISPPKLRKGLENSSIRTSPSGAQLLHDSANCNHKLFKFGKQAENFSVDTKFSQNYTSDFACSQKCCKCARMSTLWYPIAFQEVSSENVSTRNYGKRLVDETSFLCVECAAYVTKDGSWKSAWPSVFYTMCFVKKSAQVLSLFSKLPLQLKASWLFEEEVLTALGAGESLFQDITRDRLEHRNLINSYLVADFKKAMFSFSLPSVECFCGGSEFIDSAGGISFSHLINYVESSFKSFQADWRSNLRAIRSDFFKFRDEKVAFKFRPCVFVEDLGLCIASCEMHAKISRKKVIHVPNHPVVGNLSHASADRLAPLVPSLRGATPMKVGEFSNTFTMSKSVGGHKGVGSLTLHTQRNLNVDSNFLLPGIESTFLRNRLDTTETMTSIANDNNLDEGFCNGYYDRTFYTNEKLSQSLKAATCVPMSTIRKLKKQNDECDAENVNWSTNNVIENDFSDNGLLPLIPTQKLFAFSYCVSLIIVLFSTVTELGDALIDSVAPIACHLKGLIRKSSHSGYQKLLELMNLSNQASLVQIWSSICEVLTSVRIVEERQMSKEEQFTDDVLICLKQRPSSCSLETFHIPLGYTISAVESVQCRGSKNLLIFRSYPLKSTILIDCVSGETTAERGINLNRAITRMRLLILTKSSSTHSGLINLFSGQDSVKCQEHNLPLCCDFKDSGYKCCAVKCMNTSNWRCPIKHCETSICRKHLKQIENSGNWPALTTPSEGPLALEEEVEAEFECESEGYKSDANEFEEFVFLGPSCAETQAGETLDTDAGQEYLPIETSNKSDIEFLPVQLLFNVFLAVLNRSKHPLTSNLRFKRFMQCFVARNSRTSISLMQPEALIFPSVFYKQLDDGSTPGALPCFLYGPDKKCASYGFAGLLEHFRTRLTDVTLLTSSNQCYIQFAVDCLMNLQLNRKHTKVFFERGLQSLKLYHEENKLFTKNIFSVTNDSDKCVRQLASAISSMPVTFFLTLTCNQRQHPATTQLWNAINSFYSDCSEEIKKSAFSCYMSTMVRCWSRSVKYLFNLILNSAENILGNVVKIWGRAEFQTTAGNLPHYHILLWVEPGTYDIDKLIQCSEKSILHSLNEICHSELNILSPENVFDVYQNLVRIHTHDCEKSGFRCQKRRDLEGNVVCRTPPNPQSHHHWKLSIQQQYPEEALLLLEKMGLAYKNQCNELEVSEILKCEKYMYAAEQGEHILPTSTSLFALTESSVNLLRTTPRFSSSYLANYAAKSEEHADATIRSGASGKSFRLRDDGIQNKRLTSVKFALEHERERNRPVENVHCQLLAITESVFWLLGEPYVLTNMRFKHVQNVPVEKRFVQESKQVRLSNGNLSMFNFRDFVRELPVWRQLTSSQRILVEDQRLSNEVLDNMSQFSLRPPELLCIKHVKFYCQWFGSVRNKLSPSELVQLFSSENFTPFVNCQGSIVQIHPKATQLILAYIEENFASFDETDVQRCNYLRSVIESNDEQFLMILENDKELLPEIVFRSVPLRDALDFLVSFILRFGRFETELDLFGTPDLLQCYKNAGLVPVIDDYGEEDVIDLLRKYLLEELLYLPGGVLTFAAKLFSAKDAFSRLLKVAGTEAFNSPTVLIQDMHNMIEEDVEQYLADTQNGMCQRVRQLGLPNLPVDPLETRAYWEPELQISQGQSMDSFLEQQSVLRKIANSVIEKFTGRGCNNVRHQLILGRPGTGKTFLSGVILAHALCNGLLSFITSLPARRSVQLCGEHIHRMFKISTKKLDADSLASEALVRLNRDNKRKMLLKKLQLLLVEEISLINGETWSAMDTILKNLKESEQSFGGLLIVANGDVCQLPNISGYNIFEACSFLFTFDFHFLQEFVRMEDILGQELLKMLEKRPVAEYDIEKIVQIISSNCNFVSDWQTLTDRLIMKVFGKREAEQEAFQRHCHDIEESDLAFCYSTAIDEISTEGSHDWRTASKSGTNYLNKQVAEYEKVLFYPGCVLRSTQNLDGLQQGQLCILDYNSVCENSIQVYVAPSLEAVNEEALDNGDYLFWPKLTMRKLPGYVQSLHRNSLRRTQFPAINYVALTVHRLMGDTFLKLATEISNEEKKYALWLISQLYVIISRVKRLCQLFFVGNKAQTLEAIKEVLRKRNLAEERLFEMFQQLREAARSEGPGLIEGPRYLRNHFDVPRTPNGYVFLMVSVRTMAFNVFYVGETENSLSLTLREINSSSAKNCRTIKNNQPWAVGFFYWNFNDDDERKYVYDTIQRILDTTDYSYQMLLNYCNFALKDMNHIKLCICGRVVKIDKSSTVEEQ